jgi:hypothetical protein
MALTCQLAWVGRTTPTGSDPGYGWIRHMTVHTAPLPFRSLDGRIDATHRSQSGSARCWSQLTRWLRRDYRTCGWSLRLPDLMACGNRARLHVMKPHLTMTNAQAFGRDVAGRHRWWSATWRIGLAAKARLSLRVGSTRSSPRRRPSALRPPELGAQGMTVGAVIWRCSRGWLQEAGSGCGRGWRAGAALEVVKESKLAALPQSNQTTYSNRTPRIG